MKKHIMRYFTSILILALATASFGQTKDKRALLDIDGRVKEISVSPDEKIWLVTAIGNTYFTNSIDSNWHFGMALTASGDHSSLNNPNLERISFFNKDTAIMTGYISAYEKDYTKNGYYFTADAGKNWRLLDYGGNSWIYTIHTDKNGNAWMGGVHKELYYSSNFGQSWTTLKLPYKSSDRTYGIYMCNSKSGIASSDRNEIIRTEDNWNTASKIQTPLDQEKYQPSELMGYNDKRISKVILWNNFMVVNQDGNIFYSDVDIVDWKSFPIKILDFEIDIDSKKLFAVSDSFKIILFSSPTEFQTLSSKRLSNRPIDFKVVNKSLFVVSNRYEVYKVNVQEFTHSIPYTNDIEIPDPRIIKRFSTLTWGIDRNQIYLSEDSQHDWYREKALDFSVADFKLKSDSLAILWDGVKNNYLYSLKDHKPLIYYPVDPLKSFLTSRIKSFSINSGSQGCFHSQKSEVKYIRTNDSTFATSNVSQKQFKEKKVSTFNNEISGTILANTLATINSNPSAIPSLQDFQISAIDKKNYLDLVDEQLKSKELNYSGKKVINKVFYYSVPSVLDTLRSSIVGRIMNQGEAWYSTTSNWFNIQIINQNNDTLNITRNYYVSTFPWNLPWKFKYKGQYFNSCNIELSKFINACIPDDFLDKEIFDNKLLIMQIADYLYNRP